MSTVIDFAKVEWGPDEAKGDNQLQSYFYQIPDYNKLIEGEKRYVIGRKGTGKTAILQKIRLDANDTPTFFTKELTLREFPIADLRSFANKSYQNKSKYVQIWTFMILVELAKISCKDEGNQDLDSYVEIRDFLKENFPNELGGFKETLSVLKNNQAKINIFKGFLEGSKTHQEQYNIQIHYSAVIERLKELLSKINTRSYYFLLFDELDEGYKASDSNKNLLLLALFRAMEDLSLYFKPLNSISFRPILALRSDIFDNLEDNDLNKLDDYIVRLNWQSIGSYGFSLKELVNKRIRASLSIPRNMDPWNYIVNDKDKNIPYKTKSLFKYLINRTFERPRDIIKFMKYCSRCHSQGKLDYKTVSLAEREYSKWFYNELRDEIQSHLSVWKTCLGVLQKIGRGNLDIDLLREKLQQETECQDYMANSKKDVNDIIESLFDFGIIGSLDENGRSVFKYKDIDNRFNHSKKIIVHFGFEQKLRLK